LWRVTRKDGLVLRFTDNTSPLKIAIDPDGSAQTYRADFSFTASAIFMSKSAANLQSVQMSFLLSDDGFSEKDLRLRRFDGAQAEVFVVDYQHLEAGAIRMYSGKFGTVNLSNQKIATVEVTPDDTTGSGTMLGMEKYSQTCRANLFDARCKLNADSFKANFTVTSANGGSVVSTDLNQENGHWNLGFVKWLTGDNAGVVQTVNSSDKTSTSIFLTSPPPLPAKPGDTGVIYPGCDKTRVRCKQFNNLANMRAEPDVPTGAMDPSLNYALSGIPAA
jgi:uncharacterized phage protein (TIGR02218 family)